VAGRPPPSTVIGSRSSTSSRPVLRTRATSEWTRKQYRRHPTSAPSPSPPYRDQPYRCTMIRKSTQWAVATSSRAAAGEVQRRTQQLLQRLLQQLPNLISTACRSCPPSPPRPGPPRRGNDRRRLGALYHDDTLRRDHTGTGGRRGTESAASRR